MYRNIFNRKIIFQATAMIEELEDLTAQKEEAKN